MCNLITSAYTSFKQGTSPHPVQMRFRGGPKKPYSTPHLQFDRFPLVTGLTTSRRSHSRSENDQNFPVRQKIAILTQVTADLLQYINRQIFHIFKSFYNRWYCIARMAK
jgi:hypothetical protein